MKNPKGKAAGQTGCKDDACVPGASATVADALAVPLDDDQLARVIEATKLESMHLKWTNYITQEFWALGDKERSMKVPISPLCDRERDNNIAKSQMGFFKFICIPLFSVVADLVDPEMVPWVRLRKNMAMWEKKALDEVMAKGWPRAIEHRVYVREERHHILR